jgi:ribonuclease Z
MAKAHAEVACTVVSGRELVVLGTASQAPTRYRNHNGYLLRWDGFGILFDPGEGTQRQMVMAGVPSSAVDMICLTHLHGDHCLGVPGMLARMSLDGRVGTIEICFPQPSEPEMHYLLNAAVGRRSVVPVPVACGEGEVRSAPPLRVSARWLDHSVATLGWRLDEPPGRTMDRQALERAGIAGPAVGELIQQGFLDTPHGTFRLEDMSRPRRGQSFAFVMDTRYCAAAVELARGVDLLVCESTFLSGDEELAAEYRHLTARQAAELAREAGARRLLLTHFSQRYTDEAAFARDAEEVFPGVRAARDLDVVAFPSRPAERP